MAKLYTTKQLKVLKQLVNEDFFLMINHGGVRAGKTVVNNDAFLLELNRTRKQAKLDGVSKPMYILAGFTASTLYTNVIKELEDKHNLSIKYDKHGNFTLSGVYVVTTFTNNLRGLGAIRGMTSYGAYVNEASLCHPAVFAEIIKRCSARGARIICDTNPDHPRHWLKVDYIDKAEQAGNITNHFSVFDNEFLSQRYIDNLIATTPDGMETERGIYGRWVSGQGAVYSSFKPDMVVSSDTLNMVTFDSMVAGVDWGYKHYGAMVVIGIKDDCYYLIEEHAHQYRDIEYWKQTAQDIDKRYSDYNITFWCDSARPEYVQALKEVVTARNADKAIMPGISAVDRLIKADNWRVSDKATKYLDEVNQYVYNERTGDPVKENDDVQDAVRYAVYNHDKEAGVATSVTNLSNALFGGFEF